MMKKTLKSIAIVYFLAISSISFAQQPVLNFDGTNDHVNLGNNVGNGLRTIEMWFMPNSTIDATNNSVQTLIAREFSIDNTNEFNLSFLSSGVNTGRLRFNIDELGVGNGIAVFSDNATWTANQWYHVAAVINPSSGLTMFIDGTLQLDTDIAHTTSTSNAPNTPTILGHWGNSFGLNRYFDGQIDDVRISSNAVYTADFTPPCPDLVPTATTIGLWNQNEGVGTTTSDASGNGNAGTINGATWATAQICDSSSTCVCDTDLKLKKIGHPDALGSQTSTLLINTNGVAVTSICIDIPYYKTLVDLDCIQCDPTQIHTYGTILGGQPISGVFGVIADPYGYGSGRKICYTFATPTVVNTTIQLDLKFPPTLEISCCKNKVDFCFHVTIHTDPCTSCEYTICPKKSPVLNSQNLIQDNDDQIINEMIDKKSSFELSPNPAKTSVQMNVVDDSFRSGEVLFTTSDGRVVLEEKMNYKRKTIDVSHFESGSYFVTLIFNDKKSTELLVIQ